MPSIDEKAVKFVLEYEEKRRCKPIDVSRKRSIIGYDILSMNEDKNQINRTIEVKGTRKEYAIPDTAETEFTRNLTLIATHLYVVGNMDKPKAQWILYIIPREKINKEYLREKRTLHFSSTFQKQLPKKYKVKSPL